MVMIMIVFDFVFLTFLSSPYLLFIVLQSGGDIGMRMKLTMLVPFATPLPPPPT